MANKHVVFDIVGTLVSYDSLFNAIENCLGDRLRANGIKSSLLGNTWIEVAEREYTYLSLAGRYTPFINCLEKLFYRVLWMAGIQEPKEFVSDEDVQVVTDGYRNLTMRPGAVEYLGRVGGYFVQAGVDLPAVNLLSCDTAGVGKPDPSAYKPILDRLPREGKPWFAAAHGWDVTAAKTAGFRGAYSLVLEKEAIPELFGETDVTAATLPEMADGIIAST